MVLNFETEIEILLFDQNKIVIAMILTIKLLTKKLNTIIHLGHLQRAQ